MHGHWPFSKQSLSYLTVAALVLLPWVAGSVVFENIALDDRGGIDYARAPSLSDISRLDRFTASISTPLNLENPATLGAFPFKSRGAPGVAVFDYDNDGDLDLYFTNGPGAANSLFANRLSQTGNAGFDDAATAAGVTAQDQDSTGVCFGDIDNDGDDDLYVLGQGEANRLYENNGNGTFSDRTTSSGLAGGNLHAVACAMGDVNNDGLLDIVVANSYDDWDHSEPFYLTALYAGFEHNQLFLNAGGNVFLDVSQSSGFNNIAGRTAGQATLTWRVELVDFDRDGDLDILQADAQGARPPAASGGDDLGLIRIFRNDGTGGFTDVSASVGPGVLADWQGMTVGDFNCDGQPDLFASNQGVYRSGPDGLFFNNGGVFEAAEPGVGPLSGLPLGWSSAVLDYDNDGDSDIIFQGGQDFTSSLWQDNPGTVLTNTGKCSGVFDYDPDLAEISTDYRRNNVEALVVADLNQDGADDFVTLSSFFAPVTGGTEAITDQTGETGSVFDASAQQTLQFFPPLDAAQWDGLNPADGPATVEIASPAAPNRARVIPRGSIGITTGGRVNRSGIGAVVQLESLTTVFQARERRSDSAILMFVASQLVNDTTQSAEVEARAKQTGQATLDVFWPPGLRNRLADVQSGETVVFPEIPCDFDTQYSNANYAACVSRSLDELVAAGIIESSQRQRFETSAIATPTAVSAAVLPTSRSVQVGKTATAFATIVNAAEDAAIDCGIAPATEIAADFHFQPTLPLTNELTGFPGQKVDIAAGGSQTFVVALTPRSAFDPTLVSFNFSCFNADPAMDIPGVNTLLLSASLESKPDIIALAATPSGNGIVDIPGEDGSGAFAVATANVGVGGTITVRADTGQTALPLMVTVCETDPRGGECLQPPQANLTTEIGKAATATFSLFVTADGSVPLDPASNRIFVYFSDSTGVLRGSTSVAVQTTN